MLSSSQTTRMFAQIARVDEVLREKGWSLRVADDLASELGVDRRTVYRLRNRANRWTQEQLRPQDVDRWRARQLQLADEAARMALAKGDYAGVASLLKVSAGLTGTIAPTNVNVNHTTTVNPALSVKLSGLTVTELTAIAQRRAPDAEPEVVEGELVDPAADVASR